MAQKWTEELTPDMLPDGLCRVIAEEIGTDNLLKLSVLLGGSSFYLPRRERILRPLRDRKILEEYNGYNVYELCKKWDLGESMVRTIIRDKIRELRQAPIDGQVSLFDVSETE